jgi:hypothetical protein
VTFPKVVLKPRIRPNPSEEERLLESDVPRVLMEAFHLSNRIPQEFKVLKLTMTVEDFGRLLQQMGYFGSMGALTSEDINVTSAVYHAGMWFAAQYIAARLGYDVGDPTFQPTLGNFDASTMARRVIEAARTAKGSGLRPGDVA